MNEHLRLALLGGLGGLMAFFVFGGLRGLGRSGPSEPLDAVPKGSFIVVTVDMVELRRSPLHELLNPAAAPAPARPGPLQNALGMGPLSNACGFDPLARVQRLAIAVPEDGDRGEFGLAARVEVTRAELEKCVGEVSRASSPGSSSPSTPAKAREVGSFLVVDSAGSSGGSSSRTPQLAYGSGGLLVVGKGSWFDAMLGAADKLEPGLRDSADHTSMRAALTSREGFRAPTLIATALLPRSLRERLKGEMGAELGAQDRSSATMAGVLGVSSIGVAIRAGGPGQNIDASVELVCDSAEACEAVEKLVQKKRLEWSKELSLRMVGFGPLIDSVETRRESSRLRATASVNAEALASTLERVIKLQARKKDASAAPPPAAAATDRKPDESIPAKRQSD